MLKRFGVYEKIYSTYDFTDPALEETTEKYFNDVFSTNAVTLVFKLDCGTELVPMLNVCVK